MKSRPILYIKTGCPWCHDAISYLSRKNVEVDVKDILKDEEARKRMEEISGQTLTPTLEYGDFVVPDFSVDELVEALKKRPEIQEEIGLKAS